MQRDRLFHPHPITLSSAVQRGAAASHAGQGAAGGAGGVGAAVTFLSLNTPSWKGRDGFCPTEQTHVWLPLDTGKELVVTQ